MTCAVGLRLLLVGTGDEGPRARVVLVLEGCEVPLGAISPASRCDLGLADDLARLHLAARRLGGSIRLTDVRGDLREVLDLMGLGDCLEP